MSFTESKVMENWTIEHIFSHPLLYLSAFSILESRLLLRCSNLSLPFGLIIVQTLYTLSTQLLYMQDNVHLYNI